MLRVVRRETLPPITGYPHAPVAFRLLPTWKKLISFMKTEEMNPVSQKLLALSAQLRHMRDMICKRPLTA